jgi:ParB family transcriptional regulator, chromosome partitioning protein
MLRTHRMNLLALSLDVKSSEIVAILNQAANAQKRNLEMTENVFRHQV